MPWDFGNAHEPLALEKSALNKYLKTLSEANLCGLKITKQNAYITTLTITQIFQQIQTSINSTIFSGEISI